MVVLSRANFKDCVPAPPVNWLREAHAEVLSHVMLEERSSVSSALDDLHDHEHEEDAHEMMEEPEPLCQSQPQDMEIKSEPRSLDLKAFKWCPNPDQLLNSDLTVVEEATVSGRNDTSPGIEIADLDPDEVQVDTAVDIQVSEMSLEKKAKELNTLQLHLHIGKSRLSAHITEFKGKLTYANEMLEKKEQELEAKRIHLARKAASLEWLHTLVKDAERKYISAPKPTSESTIMHLGESWDKLRKNKAALEAERQALESLRGEILNEVHQLPKNQPNSQALALIGAAGDQAGLEMAFHGSSRKFKYIDMTDLLGSLPETAQTVGLMKKYFALAKAMSLMAVEITADHGHNNLASVIRLTGVSRQILCGVYEAFGFGDNQGAAFVNAFEQIYGAFIQDPTQQTTDLALTSPLDSNY